MNCRFCNNRLPASAQKRVGEYCSYHCRGYDEYIKRAASDGRPGYVYFITAPREPKYPIKIGFAGSIDGVFERLSGIQTGNPHRLAVLRYEVGTFGHEQYLHHKFRGHRIQGEWFRRNARLVTYINTPHENSSILIGKCWRAA
jgi:hypothetical protein